MEFIGKERIVKALIWSMVLSFFLLLLEVRYLIGDRETDQGLGYLFLVQALFLKKPSAVAVSFMLGGMMIVVLVHLMVFGVYGSF
jgi:hypothetical protein